MWLIVVTLALSLRLKQGLAKVQAKSDAPPSSLLDSKEFNYVKERK
jgi:hypothetical protein